MPKRIPTLAASDIAKAHDCRQVIIVAWDGQQIHVVTYGATEDECFQPAEGGNLVKRALGWPESLCNAEPNQVKKLRAKLTAREDMIRDLEGRLKHGDDVSKMVNTQLSAGIKELEAELASTKRSLNLLGLGIDEAYRAGSSDPSNTPDNVGH